MFSCWTTDDRGYIKAHSIPKRLKPLYLYSSDVPASLNQANVTYILDYVEGKPIYVTGKVMAVSGAMIQVLQDRRTRQVLRWIDCNRIVGRD
jgi:hypothetical protein